MWKLSLPWWELIARGLIVYVFLIVLLRSTGKRQIGQMSPFDLVLLLVLSNAVQNSMSGGDNSVLAGIILAITLVGANWITARMTFANRFVSKAVEGEPRILIHNGSVFEKTMKEEQVSRDELMAAIRKAGHASILEIRSAILENDGSISVIGKPQAP